MRKTFPGAESTKPNPTSTSFPTWSLQAACSTSMKGRAELSIFSLFFPNFPVENLLHILTDRMRKEGGMTYHQWSFHHQKFLLALSQICLLNLYSLLIFSIPPVTFTFFFLESKHSEYVIRTFLSPLVHITQVCICSYKRQT